MDFSRWLILALEEAVSETSQETGIVGTLGLNWKVFIAQLVNFAIIVFILWRWVFKPVTTAMQKRTEKIEQSVKKAEEVAKKVEELEKFKKTQIIQAQKEYEKIIAAAHQIASEQKEQTLKEASGQAQSLISEAERRIAAEKNKMLSEVKEELASVVISAVEKISNEKLDVQKDRALVEESLKQAVRSTGQKNR